MKDYYSQKLSAERLRKCYEIAPPRIKRYLEAEIDFILERLDTSSIVLELGCGYGRVLRQLAVKAATVVGIDTSHTSLISARNSIGNTAGYCLAEMNAARLGFSDGCFDMVACIQNGISAFKVDRRELIGEAIRITRGGGKVLFSSYAESFWEDRLKWFEMQAEHGLVGEIDYDETGNGVIVGIDGFRATTVGAEEFISLVTDLGLVPKITEVDGSSIFCEISAE